MTNAPVFAAANPFLVLLVLGVTLAFYIVQAVFKSTMEPKKLQPPARPARPPASQNPQPAPSQAISSLEDYLKEARRRRAMESGAIPPPIQESRPAPPRVARLPQPETFKPVLAPATVSDQRTTKPGQPPTIPSAPRPTKKAKQPKLVPVATTFQEPAVASVPPGQPLKIPLQVPASYPQQITGGSKPTPLAEWIAGSLRDPKSIASALVLREILGPPASARARRLPTTARQIPKGEPQI